MNVGKAIKLCRIQKDFTLFDLSNSTNLSVSYISLIEQGKRNPNMAVLQSMADGLGIPLSILLFLAADPQDFKEMNPELVGKLSTVALELMKASVHESV